GPARRSPFTYVPFWLPRSSTKSAPSRRSKRQCRRDTFPSTSCRSASDERPSVACFSTSSLTPRFGPKSANSTGTGSSLRLCLLGGETITALPLGKRCQRLLQLLAPEVGPEDRGEVELGVGRLPEQEVGQPLFTRCADEQVQRWEPLRGQRPPEA